MNIIVYDKRKKFFLQEFSTQLHLYGSDILFMLMNIYRRRFPNRQTISIIKNAVTTKNIL